MTTVLQYLVIAAVVGLLLFGVALLLFGRGERLSALPARTSPARLPERGIVGSDVRQVRFALAVRGYRMSDVDWTLERLADELDRTRHQLALLTPGTAGVDSGDADVTDQPHTDHSHADRPAADADSWATEVADRDVTRTPTSTTPEPPAGGAASDRDPVTRDPSRAADTGDLHDADRPDASGPDTTTDRSTRPTAPPGTEV